MKIVAKSWEKDIEADRLDSIKSVNFALGIEKGVASDLMFNSELNKIQKKGSEIKEKLEKEKVKEAISLANDNVKINNIKSKIEEQPAGDPYIEGSEYKKFSYEQIYKEGVEESKALLMRTYNHCLHKYCFDKRDLDKLITMISNIQDSKTYDLTLDIATKLGF